MERQAEEQRREMERQAEERRREMEHQLTLQRQEFESRVERQRQEMEDRISRQFQIHNDSNKSQRHHLITIKSSRNSWPSKIKLPRSSAATFLSKTD